MMVIPRFQAARRFRASQAWLWTAGVTLSMSLLFGQSLEKKPKRHLAYEREVETASTWTTFPVWRGEMLLWVDHNESRAPIICTMGRDGRRDETLFTVEGAARITVHQITASPTGEFALVAYAVTDDLRGSTFLARIAPDRKSQLITRTWPYAPTVVTFAPDGNVWTIGHVYAEDMSRDLAYHVLRRFDSSGRVLSSRTLRIKGAGDGESLSFFVGFRDRVGWLTRSREYLEFALDGSEIARYEGPGGSIDNPHGVIDGISMAVNDEGDVVVVKGAREKPEFSVLNRETRTWMPVEVKGATYRSAQLLGFDGSALLTTSGNRNFRRLQFGSVKQE